MRTTHKVAIFVDKDFKSLEDYELLKVCLDVAILPTPEGIIAAGMGNKQMVEWYSASKKLWKYDESIKAESIIFFWDGENPETAKYFKAAHKSGKELAVFMYKQGEYFDNETIANGDFRKFFKKHYE